MSEPTNSGAPSPFTPEQEDRIRALIEADRIEQDRMRVERAEESIRLLMEMGPGELIPLQPVVLP
ncbi:MAG: hypothetical protein NVV72_01180 [Asticcacaulis sp.]|nr:hypothetical protein [Asticcacaulis sp.]